MATFATIIVAAFAILLLSHCSPRKGAQLPEPPERASARATVLAVSNGIAAADKTCAHVALAMPGSAKGEASELAHACADAYKAARAGLMLAEATLDYWAADQAGQLGCGMRAGLRGLHAFEELLAVRGGVPAAVSDAIQLANVAVQFAPVQCASVDGGSHD